MSRSEIQGGLATDSAGSAASTPLRRWSIAGAAFCGFMLALHIAAGYNSAGVADFWRDMYWATKIAHAEAFPLSGPPIYQLFELGPWWFYLLAAPIWLTHRVAAASIFIQMLAAMKYFLAWRIGTRAIDARFGLVFAVSLAASGWALAPILFPTHSALTETTILLLWLATWRCRKRLNLVSAALFGLAAAACLHAHPATILYILAAACAVLWQHRSWQAFALLGLAACIVLLTLAPAFFDPRVVDAAFQKSVSTYAAHDFGNVTLERFAGFVKGLWIGGVWSSLLLMTPWNVATVTAVWATYGLCMVISASAIFHLTARKALLHLWLLLALTLLLAQILFLLCIRPITPIWMTPTCLVPLAFATAIGWYGLIASQQRLVRNAGVALLLLVTAIGVAPFHSFLGDIQEQRSMLQANPYRDITQSADQFETAAVTFVPVRNLDRLGRMLCEPLTLHALLAKSIELSLEVTARNACGYWPDLEFAGTQPGEHRAGISLRAADAIGLEPDQTIAGMAIYRRLRAIAPAAGERVDRLARRQVSVTRTSTSPAPWRVEFDAGPNDVFCLTDRFSNLPAASQHEISASGAPAKLLYAAGGLRLYGCAGCTGDAPVHWSVDIDAVAQHMDLVVLEAKAKNLAR